MARDHLLRVGERPSITVRFPPEDLTRLPTALGSNWPSRASDGLDQV
jgi:hypothetical protein